MPAARHSTASELVAILNERDELGLVAPLLEQLVREIGALPGWRAALAWANVQAGRAEEARARDRGAHRRRVRGLPARHQLPAALAVLAHAVGELGDAVLAARVEPQLAPYADPGSCFGAGAATLGPVAYCSALLQLLQDRHDAAASFELALELSERMRARPYEARSRAGLAEALRRRGGRATRRGPTS